ncbi:hypothetical protein ABIB40_002221 [Pedobacter sp. UYP30]|uniref:hypothetical protein n=1 Tax=Pedobacter sp. UYP30 TaxID=1756400 RepID=UPI003390A4E9
MKNRLVMGMLSCALCVGLSLGASAQTKKNAVERTADKTGKVVTKAANKTAEVAVKGEAKVTDKVWKGKMAPNGSDVYINNKNKKYYVNKKGAKIWLKASQIKNRPEKD